MKHFSNQELLEISNRTPAIIQDALSSEETINAITSLGAQFHLHVDQIGILAELNVQMLLGLVGPQEFLQDLIAIGISDGDARQIMTEINEKIFIPLHERMRNMGTTSQTVIAAEVPKPVRPSVPVPSYVPPKQNVTPQSRGVTYSTQTDSVPTQSAKESPAIHNYIASLPPKTVMPGSQVPTSPSPDTRSAPDIEVPVVPNIPESPMMNLPGAMAPIPAPARVQSPPAPARPPYSADPYREPID